MAVITISKEFGTRSDAVAALAAEKLGYETIGDRLLSKIAKDLNISESEAEVFRQASGSRILRLVDRYTCSLVQKVVDREHGCLDDKNYYETTRRLVENLYNEGNVIILGWGGQCILRGRAGTLHVRLIKDHALKVSEVMAAKNLDESAAAAVVEREEKDLKAYIRHYFDEDWNDARLYDLVIDMGKTTAEQAADRIVDNIAHMK